MLAGILKYLKKNSTKYRAFDALVLLPKTQERNKKRCLGKHLRALIYIQRCWFHMCMSWWKPFRKSGQERYVYCFLPIICACSQLRCPYCWLATRWNHGVWASCLLFLLLFPLLVFGSNDFFCMVKTEQGIAFSVAGRKRKESESERKEIWSGLASFLVDMCWWKVFRKPEQKINNLEVALCSSLSTHVDGKSS